MVINPNRNRNHSFMHIIVKTLFVGVILCGAGFSEYAPNLPPDSSRTEFLHRLSVRYGIALPDCNYYQPSNRKEIVTFLSRIDSLNEKNALSASDALYLQQLKNRLDPTRGLVHWRNEKEDIYLRLYLSLLGDLNPRYKDSGAIAIKGIAAPMLTGSIGAFSFYSGATVWSHYQSDTTFYGHNYQPYLGTPYNLYGKRTHNSGHTIASDIPRGGIRFGKGRMTGEAAIDYLRIGPSVFYPLTFSGLAPPLTYVRATIDLMVADYSHAAGFLRSQKDRQKFFYTHRLQTSFWDSRLRFGLNEVIVTGSATDENLGSENPLPERHVDEVREWEWAYMVPFVPFKFIEHYAGDRDNAAVSFDFELRWPSSARWYMEFFIDDYLTPWEIFSDDWGNKWALTSGAQYFGNKTNLTLEYSHVEPWVYTHIFGGSHRYTHFGHSLGSPLGPNSQALLGEVDYAIGVRSRIGVRCNATAKNASVRGGDIRDVFQDGKDAITKRFLGPGTRWSVRPGLYWKFNHFGLFGMTARYEIDLAADKGKSFLYLYGGLYF